MTLTGHISVKATISALILCIACSAPDSGRKNRAAEGYLKIIAAEINRPTTGVDLEFLIEATNYREFFCENQLTCPWAPGEPGTNQ
ncbi:MAG: hypothetical protein Ct9H300mP15_11320 [Gemmatimonadota bacterium]|nr:MAG: hypothetical protein Ct9H300mP15_11320 [Gemmatimonadota bacterium]